MAIPFQARLTAAGAPGFVFSRNKTPVLNILTLLRGKRCLQYDCLPTFSFYPEYSFPPTQPDLMAGVESDYNDEPFCQDF